MSGRAPGNDPPPEAIQRREEWADMSRLAVPPESTGAQWIMIAERAGSGRPTSAGADAIGQTAAAARIAARSSTGSSMSLSNTAFAGSSRPCLPTSPRSSGAPRSRDNVSIVSPSVSGSAPGRRGLVSARRGPPSWPDWSRGHAPVSNAASHPASHEKLGYDAVYAEVFTGVFTGTFQVK